MFTNMPLFIRKFLDFINEEYELIRKIQKAAPKSKTLRLPYSLENHTILALADNPKNSKIFAELLVNGETLCLEYGDEEGTHDVCYNFNNYDDVTVMMQTAYTDWKQKIEDLHLSEEDICIDEFSK